MLQRNSPALKSNIFHLEKRETNCPTIQHNNQPLIQLLFPKLSKKQFTLHFLVVTLTFIHITYI